MIFAEEWRPMLRLAMPLVAAKLGWVAMEIVDAMMVGRVSATAIGISAELSSTPSRSSAPG
jgi:Na+-driven multidrug efflux pump